MSNIVNITMENVQQELLEASQQKLILIDFWADWCEPCKQLMPVLEKIALEYPEQLTLAKINCDEQQQIAMQFGVKSLPTVVLFKDGQPVDGFAGVQPESEIRALLAKHLPKPQDDLFAKGTQLAQEQNWADAYPLFKQAYELEPDNTQYTLMLANAAIELGRLDEAESLLATITLVNQDAAYAQVMSKLDLAKQAQETPEIKNLQDALAQSPESFELRHDLAVALHQVNRDEEALDNLYSILKKDLGFGESKKTFLDIIASLPAGDELAGKYRRKLYALLY